MSDNIIFIRRRKIIASAFSYNATKFTTDDYLDRGTMGLSDGKTGLFSVWIKFNGGDNADQFLCIHPDFEFFKIHRQTDNTIRIVGYTPLGVVTLENLSTATVTADGNWHHILIAWDLATAANQIYIDGAASNSAQTNNNNNIDYTETTYRIGSDVVGNGLNADISEYYLAYNQTLDITNAANRAKFRTAGGKPENLGPNGETPIGTTPTIYLKNVYSSFGVNSGAGGDFTVHGTLATATPP